MKSIEDAMKRLETALKSVKELDRKINEIELSSKLLSSVVKGSN